MWKTPLTTFSVASFVRNAEDTKLNNTYFLLQGLKFPEHKGAENQITNISLLFYKIIWW